MIATAESPLEQRATEILDLPQECLALIHQYSGLEGRSALQQSCWRLYQAGRLPFVSRQHAVSILKNYPELLNAGNWIDDNPRLAKRLFNCTGLDLRGAARLQHALARHLGIFPDQCSSSLLIPDRCPLTGSPRTISCVVALSKNLLITGTMGLGGTIQLLDVTRPAGQDCICTLKTDEPVSYLIALPCGRVVSAHACSLRLWDVSRPEDTRCSEVYHSSCVEDMCTGLAWLRDSMLVCTFREKVEVWNLDRPAGSHCQHTFREKGILDIAVLSEDRLAIAYQNKIAILRLADGAQLVKEKTILIGPAEEDGTVKLYVLHPGLLVSCTCKNDSQPGKLEFWDINRTDEEECCVKTLDLSALHRGMIDCYTFLPSGLMVALSYVEGDNDSQLELLIIDVLNRAEGLPGTFRIKTVPIDSSFPFLVRSMPDGRLVTVEGGALKIWDY